MPKDLPFMKWYPADFENDEEVSFMTFEEKGFYLTCLNRAWLNNGLPGTLEGIARTLRVPTSEIERLWVLVGKKFFLRDGRYFNRRQEEDRAAALEVSSKRAASGKRGAMAKHKQLPQEEVAIATLDAGNCQNFASIRASESDSVSVSLRNTEKLETISSESTELAATFDLVSKAICIRHPAKRRDLTPWQVEANLRMILGLRDIRADPEKISYLLAIDRRHRLLCESEEWREQGGKFAKGLNRWLKPESGLYDIEPPADLDGLELSLEQRAALSRRSFSDDPTSEYHEFMRANLRQSRAS